MRKAANEKGCGNAAALSWKVCRCVQTGLALGSPTPLKLFAQAFVACHEIVKGQNGMREKMFLFFPTRFGASKRWRAISCHALPLFPEWPEVRER
jgi:hypothetical protein